MNFGTSRVVVYCFTCSLAFGLACGDDDDRPGTQADRFGVGAECGNDDECYNPEGSTIVSHCLTEFKGGYCGIKDCAADADCPQGSACVAHDNGASYCFRLCSDKSQCNLSRSPEFESNCSSNIEFVESGKGDKACVPPSG